MPEKGDWYIIKRRGELPVAGMFQVQLAAEDPKGLLRVELAIYVVPISISQEQLFVVNVSTVEDWAPLEGGLEAAVHFNQASDASKFAGMAESEKLTYLAALPKMENTVPPELALRYN